MTDDRMREFISTLPNAGELDPTKRAENEREIARRLGGLSATERATFETELRALVREQDEKMTFKQRWTAANAADALKKQRGKG